jgi:PTH1 family peptidyl-tRNA hydrolase
MAVSSFANENHFPEFFLDKKSKSLISESKLGKEKIVLILPDTFMNKSGDAVRKFVKNKKAGEKLIVIHDDLDIPFGKFKISFNKSSGGHKGVESVIKAIKTEAFIRLRVGISPVTASGKLKKPSGDKIIGDFILASFKSGDMAVLKKVYKKTNEALSSIVKDGLYTAMSNFNNI